MVDMLLDGRVDVADDGSSIASSGLSVEAQRVMAHASSRHSSNNIVLNIVRLYTVYVEQD